MFYDERLSLERDIQHPGLSCSTKSPGVQPLLLINCYNNDKLTRHPTFENQALDLHIYPIDTLKTLFFSPIHFLTALWNQMNQWSLWHIGYILLLSNPLLNCLTQYLTSDLLRYNQLKLYEWSGIFQALPAHSILWALHQALILTLFNGWHWCMFFFFNVEHL